MENKKYNSYLPIYFSVVLIFGILIGLLLGNRSGDFFGMTKKTDKVNEVLQFIESNYVDTMSRYVLEGKAISGLLQGLDRSPTRRRPPVGWRRLADSAMCGAAPPVGPPYRAVRRAVAQSAARYAVGPRAA